MEQPRSVYSYGASDGLKMGLYLSGVFILEALGMRMPTLLIFGVLMLLATPLVAYLLMRKAYVEMRGLNSFAGVWLHGIVMFLCGSLILAMVMYVYLRFLDPTLLSDILDQLIDVYEQIPADQQSEMLDVLQKMRSEGLLPSPIQYAFSMVWTCSFFGSILSMILALIVRSIPVRCRETN